MVNVEGWPVLWDPYTAVNRLKNILTGFTANCKLAMDMGMVAEQEVVDHFCSCPVGGQ